MGGTLIVTPFSGIVDVNDQVRLGGYPGAFRDVLGVWTEEFYPLQEGETFQLDNGWSGQEWTEHVHVDQAEVLARYQGGPLDGEPAVTVRTHLGGGRAIYVSAGIDSAAIEALVADLVRPDPGPVTDTVPGLEVGIRETESDEFVFLINHAADDAEVRIRGHELLTGLIVEDALTVPAGDVRVLHRRKAGGQAE
jgi:beta-galactosidase